MTEIVRKGEILDSPERVEIGQWYWLTSEDTRGKKFQWMGCVTAIGSNYVGLEGVGERFVRVLNEDFWDQCTREPSPTEVIEGEITKYREKVAKLLGQVRELTRQLAVAPSDMLPEGGGETKALAVLGMGQDLGQYKASLIKAKDKTLPSLFQQIERASKMMAKWMEAQLIPMNAEALAMQDCIAHIHDRIFHVQLYAGLTEDVVQVQEGEPPAEDTQIHLMQRRLYMDEECLLSYEAGGMEFSQIEEFDEWLARPKNLARILPFPRTVVSFQVRRNPKEREVHDLGDIIRVGELAKLDVKTFVYIRNGEQLFRMNTGIEFGPQLFPDLNDAQLKGDKLWAKMCGEHVDHLITEREYKSICEEESRERSEWDAKVAELDAKKNQWEADKAAGKDVPDREPEWWVGFPPHEEAHRYRPFDQSHVYYDEICKKVAKDIKDHNRIVLVLQGLLDRSPVFVPHPKWHLWSADGFEGALALVLDDTRTLPAGEKPDFEAYRAKCNESLRSGAVTVGQQEAWMASEVKKERQRRDPSHGHFYTEFWHPYGNNGPGDVARVEKYSKQKQRCTYAWNRERLRYSDTHGNEPIRTSFVTSGSRVLNLDAYKPGDFHIFFDDPRTRTEYLQWAPLLLAGEDYHAGVLEISDPPPAKSKRESSYEGKLRYQREKRRKELLLQKVRLTRDVVTTDGTVYEVGTLWKVVGGKGGTFALRSEEEGRVRVGGMLESDFELI